MPQFPTLLQDIPYLMALHSYHRIVEQRQQVVDAEIHHIHLHVVHDVKQQLCHIKLNAAAVAAEDCLISSFSFCKNDVSSFSNLRTFLTQ